MDDIFIFGDEYYIRKNDSIYEINDLEDKKNNDKEIILAKEKTEQEKEKTKQLELKIK